MRWLTQHVEFGVGLAHAWEIDKINILEATKLAMLRALNRLPSKPDCLILDALTLPAYPQVPQWAIIRGDATCAAIAAASIIAKVVRDRLMVVYDKRYPRYGLARHKGYPTAAHRAAIRQYGITPLHRQTFRGVKEYLAGTR